MFLYEFQKTIRSITQAVSEIINLLYFRCDITRVKLLNLPVYDTIKQRKLFRQQTVMVM